MNNLKRYLTSPFFLSFIPFLIVVLIIQGKFNRYLLDIEASSVLSEGSYVMFDDLDNDGSSEKITAFDTENSTGITIRKNNDDVIGQWNLNGSFNFFSKKCLYITGDKDGNGIKEIYIFTIAGDSIMLHCISGLNDISLTLKNRFLTKVGHGFKTPDPFIIPAEMDDLDNDGTKELIFGIGSGFSVYPRKVYAYFIKNDSLVCSPESSYFIYYLFQADINGDGTNEIIPYGYATSNVKPGNAKYHDYSNFLMVLGNDLKFLFEPIEFKGENSILNPFVIKGINGQVSLAVLYVPPSSLNNSTIYHVNDLGLVLDTTTLPFHAFTCFNTSFLGNNKFYLITSKLYGLGLYNERFKLIRNLPEKERCLIIQKDIDKDGLNEIILVDFERGIISVLRDGLKKPCDLKFNSSGIESSFISFIDNLNLNPVISLQSGGIQYLLYYRQNPNFPFYYLLYLVIYLSILSFALIIKSVQKNLLKKKYDTEKKIAELQLAIVRNQLDPHFTLNAINSIIYSVENSSRDQAGQQLRRFANLYRNLLLSANSIRRTIRDELDFCKDYLELEKAKFGDKFEYFISISDEVNNQMLIPKMLIQLYVENAIKHGLAQLQPGGLLEISLKEFLDSLVIEIKDNGIGRKKASTNPKESTGKGLEIMNELYSIYNKYYNESISCEIIDLKDGYGKATGTMVKLTVKTKK